MDAEAPADTANDAAMMGGGSDDAVQLRRLLAALLTLHVFIALYFAKDMIMPVVLGSLIALALSPAARAAARFGVPAPVAALTLIGGSGGMLLVIGYSFSDRVGEWLSQLPKLGADVKARLSHVSESVDAMKSASADVEKLTNSGNAPVVAVEQPSLMSAAFENVAGLGTTLAVAFVLALFLLSSGTLFYEKLVNSFQALSAKKHALRSVYELQRQISRYLFTVTLINAGLGICVGVAAYIIGMPNAAFWGVLAFALNFLPFLGSVVGTALIAAVSIVTFDDLGYAFLAPAAYLALGTIEGQLVTPAIVGRSLKINTVSVFLSVIFWAWLWGIAGALLAVPILVVIKVVCDGVLGLKGIGNFLSADVVTRPPRDHQETGAIHAR